MMLRYYIINVNGMQSAYSIDTLNWFKIYLSAVFQVTRFNLLQDSQNQREASHFHLHASFDFLMFSLLHINPV